MVMIVRHAEKPTKSNNQLGIRPNGDHDHHSLSVRGWTRAGALVGLFAPQHGEPRGGLLRPDAIYAGPAVPTHWPDDRLDVVWTLTPEASGWRFAQVPQLVLAGDRPDPIG